MHAHQDAKKTRPRRQLVGPLDVGKEGSVGRISRGDEPDATSAYIGASCPSRARRDCGRVCVRAYGARGDRVDRHCACGCVDQVIGDPGAAGVLVR